MKIIFMGTPEFSVRIFEALIDAGHEVCLAVTQPDKPKGRGKKIQPPPVKEAAIRRSVPVFQPKRVRKPESIEELKKYNADVIVVAAFGQILPEAILQMTPYGCINVHASLLPAYRGAAPIQWAIISGEKATGVTTMQMDPGIDTGDMIMQKEVPIDEGDSAGTLTEKLARVGAALIVETLKSVREGTAVRTKQGESPTPYAKTLDKESGDIDWALPATEIERLVRGLDPQPGAYTYLGDRVLKIWKAKAAPESSFERLPHGTVSKVGKDFIAVATGQGDLLIYELQLAGKKRMDTAAFLRGCKVEAGTCLTKGSLTKGE